MKVYHGTSADNLQSILEHGFDGMFHGEQIWSCSAGMNYFWNPADLKRAEGLDSMEDAIQYAKQHAKESAEVSLGHAKDCRRVVFEVEIPRNELDRDTSCRNMEGSVMTPATVPPSAIKKIWIDEGSLEAMKGYFIACGMDHELRCYRELTKIEQVIGKVFKESDNAMSSMFDMLSDIDLVEYGPQEMVTA